MTPDPCGASYPTAETPVAEGAVTVGSLCSGYTGLDMGLALALGVPIRHAWHVEYDGISKKGELTGPRKILAHHYPDVPNHVDLTTLDPAALEPVDWLTAGYPCQPFSHAGKRKGASDERHLWPHVARTIGALRPRNVLLENVRGHVSLGLDAVLGDLAVLGYDASWGLVRASDAGAPHPRARVFILATDARRERHGRREDPGGLGRLDGPDESGTRQRQRSRPEPVDRGAAVASDSDGLGHERAGLAWGRGTGPADSGGAAPDALRAGLQGLHSVTGDLRAEQPTDSGPAVQWRGYEQAIRRWERTIGRPAPRPTEPGRAGELLSPRFVEWLMGLPEGWVTDVPGLPRRAQIKALGNGVVPQQAALALRLLLPTACAVAA